MILRFALMIAVLGYSSLVSAQTLTGHITDTQKLSLPGATVTLVGSPSIQSFTDADGHFSLSPVPTSGQIVIHMDGFTVQTVDFIRTTETLTVPPIRLVLAGLSESVTVTETAAVLTTRGQAFAVTSTQLTDIPLNGRMVTTLLMLAPGVTSDSTGNWSSIRLSGKSNQQTAMTLDGVDNSFVWDATPGYLSVTGAQFRVQAPIEGLADVQVTTGIPSVTTGHGTGGVVSLTTKAGGLDWHGSIVSTLRPSSWSSPSPYDNQRYPLTATQHGAGFGGSIGRTRLFLSSEALLQTQSLAFTEAVPTAAARARILTSTDARIAAVLPLLAGFPEAQQPTANPWLGLVTRTSEATQREGLGSLRVDVPMSTAHSLVLRGVWGYGRIDTPDRTVTPRRVRATETLQNGLLQYRAVRGTFVQDVSLALNAPYTSALAYATAAYDALGVSLSGTVTSGSIDARGTTGIARSGLLIRGSSASSTIGSTFRPQSRTILSTTTWQRGAHLVTIGGEYRQIRGSFQFRGSQELVFNSIDDFLMNRPNFYAVAQDSPVFHPEQFYAVGYVQDTWQINDRLTVDLGVRYDYYSVVRERDRLARPFFVEENAFGTNPDATHNPDRNNVAPRLSATYAVSPRTTIRAGYGMVYGPGQFEDRIQPMENMIVRQRVAVADVPTLAYPVAETTLRSVQAIRGTTHQRPDEYSVYTQASVVQRLPFATDLTVGYTNSRGHDMFMRGISNTLDIVTRTRPIPAYGQIDYKTSGCVDGLTLAGMPVSGCGVSSFDALQLSLTRSAAAGLSGVVQYQYSRNRGTTQGSNEAATAQNTFDFASEWGTNPQDLPHTVTGTVTYTRRGWSVSSFVTARSGVPINVTINRPDNVTVNGATVTNIPGGNTRGTQRPDLVPGVNPYLKQGTQWLNPAAFKTPQPGTFGNTPRNFLRGPAFWQADVAVSKTWARLTTRIEVFNITNQLNYESPAANLPNGAPGVAFTRETAGTFGAILGPLNRGVGLGGARQVQASLRWSW